MVGIDLICEVDDCWISGKVLFEEGLTFGDESSHGNHQIVDGKYHRCAYKTICKYDNSSLKCKNSDMIKDVHGDTTNHITHYQFHKYKFSIPTYTNSSNHLSSHTICSILLLFLFPLISCSSFNEYECSYTSQNICNIIPPSLSVGKLSQRDISFNISIDQVSTWGIDLTNIFQVNGYTTQSLTTLQNALDIGYNSISIDAYWSNENNQWQLCPLPFPKGITPTGEVYLLNDNIKCQDNVTLDSIYSTISGFITKTDNDAIALNMILLDINLHVLNITEDFNNNIIGDNILSTNITNAFGSKVYTPVDLQHDRTSGMVTNGGKADIDASKQYPPLHYFLLTLKKRIIVRVDETDLTVKNGNDNSKSATSLVKTSSASNSAGNSKKSTSTLSTTTTSPSPTPPYQQINGNTKVVFTSNTTSNQSIHVSNNLLTNCTTNIQPSSAFINFLNQTSLIPFRSVYDSIDLPFTNSSLDIISQCGYSITLNSSTSTHPTTPETLVNSLQNSFWTWAPNEPNTNKSSSSSSSPVALKCAVITNDGWKVANCYDSFPVLCRVNQSPFNWTLTTEANYFKAGEACPPGTEFSAPRSSLEDRSAKYVLGSKQSAWVDFNSIAVADCWVTGGPFSGCPYHQIPTVNRNGVALLSIAAAVSFSLLMTMILLNFRRIPLRRNQARWRRHINKFSEQEYEGVPL